MKKFHMRTAANGSRMSQLGDSIYGEEITAVQSTSFTGSGWREQGMKQRHRLAALRGAWQMLARGAGQIDR